MPRKIYGGILTSPENEINQKSPHILKLSLCQITKYITVVIDHRPEANIGHNKVV